jgi:hypothetical protein
MGRRIRGSPISVSFFIARFTYAPLFKINMMRRVPVAKQNTRRIVLGMAREYQK